MTSAIEQALWDILGQHLGVPIRTLLGGPVRERIRLYANINRHVTDRRPEGFAPFLTRPVVDVLMPDVKHDGGLLETKRIAGAARMHKLLVAPHNPAGPVSTAATGQLVSTLTNFLILEYAWGEAEWRHALLNPPERIEGGDLLLPEGPGLGHRLNDDMVRQHEVYV